MADAYVVRTPAVSMRSLTSSGTPASRPLTPARARASASSAHTVMTAFSSGRAAIASSAAVTAASASATEVRDGLDLQQRAGHRETADLDERARRARRAEELLAHRVDLGAVVDVEQVDDHLDHVPGLG